MLDQSSIDVALWIVIEDNGEEFDHKKVPQGYLLTYVDDFLVVGCKNVRNAIEEEISRIWTITVPGDIDQFEKNLEKSVTFLSSTIRSHPTLGAFTMSQEEFIRDVLSTWEMLDCRPLTTPGEPVSTVLPQEKNKEPDDVPTAQKMDGSLIWLSTRTRPDISYAQSRISPLASKAPKRAALEGLRLLRFYKEQSR